MKKTKILLVGLVSLVGLISLVALHRSNQHRDSMEAGGAVRDNVGAASTPSLTVAPTPTRPHNCTNPGCSDSGASSVKPRVQGRVVNDGEAPSDPALLSSEDTGEESLEGESRAPLEGESKADDR
jgi:hypothetical protein